LLRKDAFASQDFADTDEIAYAVELTTQHLNQRAKPWVWGRPPPAHRQLRRRFVSLL